MKGVITISSMEELKNRFQSQFLIDKGKELFNFKLRTEDFHSNDAEALVFVLRCPRGECIFPDGGSMVATKHGYSLYLTGLQKGLSETGARDLSGETDISLCVWETDGDIGFDYIRDRDVTNNNNNSPSLIGLLLSEAPILKAFLVYATFSCLSICAFFCWIRWRHFPI